MSGTTQSDLPAATGEAESLVAAARLVGRLLLREADAPLLRELAAPDLAAGLAELGLEPPAAVDDGTVDRLAAEYFDSLLSPERGGPPVQSLWTSGGYEGDAAVAVRALAKAAGAEFDRELARGAAIDHIGSILFLWASCRGPLPAVARRLEAEHLTWALGPLGILARGQGFYPGVARAAVLLIAEISRSAAASAASPG